MSSLSSDLLRTGIVGRHHSTGANRSEASRRAQLRQRQLGNTEVEELWNAFRRDEYVAGFNVAVDGKLLMRELDSKANQRNSRIRSCTDGLRLLENSVMG
jgi:hypothetical protein